MATFYSAALLSERDESGKSKVDPYPLCDSHSATDSYGFPLSLNGNVRSHIPWFNDKCRECGKDC